jgi:enoyl-CoA hydratase/carnithine racemase
MAGYQRAAELLLLGEPFGAAQARDVGFVNHVLAPDRGTRRGAHRGREACRQTGRCRAAHQAADAQVAGRDGPEGDPEEGELFVGLLSSPAAKEAFTAFFEKRKPDFSKFG